MTLTITATETVTTLNGVPARLWEGVTEDGIPCKVFVHRVAVSDLHDSAAFDRRLKAELPPAKHLPLALIL